MAAAVGSTRGNNFDLIRLFAASQVVLGHGTLHLDVSAFQLADALLRYFPGVPIFFVISGFLISLSWERAPSLRQYVWNRILRIYPALWVCLLISIGIFLACGVRPDSPVRFAAWLIGQVTVVQYYNPEFLRGFGTGVLNGSLWTIPTELQFYALVPALAVLAGRIRWRWVAYAAVAGAMTMVIRWLLPDPVTPIQKLVTISILPFLYYFLVGVLMRLAYEGYPNLFQGRAVVWFLVYGAWAVVESSMDIGGRTGNQLNLISIVLLGFVVVSTAFSWPTLSQRLLGGNDISYGVYIYHVPIINLLMFEHLMGVAGFAVMAVGTFAAAILSWRLVEKPALRLKNYSLRPANPP